MISDLYTKSVKDYLSGYGKALRKRNNLKRDLEEHELSIDCVGSPTFSDIRIQRDSKRSGVENYAIKHNELRDKYINACWDAIFSDADLFDAIQELSLIDSNIAFLFDTKFIRMIPPKEIKQMDGFRHSQYFRYLKDGYKLITPILIAQGRIDYIDVHPENIRDLRELHKLNEDVFKYAERKYQQESKRMNYPIPDDIDKSKAIASRQNDIAQAQLMLDVATIRKAESEQLLMQMCEKDS